MAFGVNIVPLTRPTPPRAVPQPDFCGYKLCSSSSSSPQKDDQKHKPTNPFNNLAEILKDYLTPEGYHRRMSLADEFAAFARAYPYSLPRCPEPETIPDPTLFHFDDDFMDVSPIGSTPEFFDPQPIYSFMEFLRTANSELYEPIDSLSTPAHHETTPEEPVLDADFWTSLREVDPALFEPPTDASGDYLRKTYEEYGAAFWGMPWEEYKAMMEEAQAQLDVSWLPSEFMFASE